MVKVAGAGSKQILIGVLAQVRKRREVLAGTKPLRSLRRMKASSRLLGLGLGLGDWVAGVSHAPLSSAPLVEMVVKMATICQWVDESLPKLLEQTNFS